MPTFMLLANYTEQGYKNIKDSPSRLDKAKQDLETMGCKVRRVFLGSGSYEIIMILDAPDGSVVERFILKLNAQGNVRAQQIRAWPEEEYREIVGRL